MLSNISLNTAITFYYIINCMMCNILLLSLFIFTLCCVNDYGVSSTKLGWLDCSLTVIMYTETPTPRNGSLIQTCLQTSLSSSHFRIAFTWIPQLWLAKGERGLRFTGEGKVCIHLWWLYIFVLTCMLITWYKTSPIYSTGSVSL